MIPIYYSAIEDSFTTNGLGRLVDCISCTVTEERNGIFECEFTYPITGRFYNDLLSGGVVGVAHDDHHDIQPFEVYKHSAPINGVVTFNASHISYRLNKITVNPFSASTCALALQGIKDNAVTGCPFTFWTDKATAADFAMTVPKNARSILAGEQGSILDVFGGGEYKFDKFSVKLYASRGTSSGVTIRYGKNMTDVKMEQDKSGAVTGVVPYWTDGTTTVVGDPVVSAYAPTSYPWTEENGVEITTQGGEVIEFAPAVVSVIPYDFSNAFESAPSLAELKQAAEDYLTNNTPWIADENITVDFVQLWQTPEYANVAALQRVGLCDTVSVFYPELGVIQSNQKVIKTVYNVLLERFDSMELGQLKTTLAQSMTGTLRTEIEQTESVLRGVIEHATEMITGGLGGYVVMNLNADGEPQEILIMDTDDIATAVNVIRMNKNGIGFSNNGYNGPFRSAWTIDGRFNADFVAAGHLLANYIQGGTLTLGGLNNVYGTLRILDEYGAQAGEWTRYGIGITLNSGNTLWFGPSGGMSFTLESGSRVNNVFTNYQALPDGTAYNKTIGGFEFATPEDNYISKIDPFGLSLIHFINGSGSVGLGISFFTGLTIYNQSYQSPTVFAVTTSGDILARSLSISGTKSRVASTKDYADRLLYCYETPSPMFGDVGEGVIGDDGLCFVWLDPIFAETISTTQYQVFVQPYGEGVAYVTERKPGYFCVKGTPGLAFGWEIKAKQADFDQLRLERKTDEIKTEKTDYGKSAIEHLEELKGART